MKKLKQLIFYIKLLLRFNYYKIKIFYIKYMLGQCRKRCSKCLYRNDCFANLE